MAWRIWGRGERWEAVFERALVGEGGERKLPCWGNWDIAWKSRGGKGEEKEGRGWVEWRRVLAMSEKIGLIISSRLC